MFTSTTDAGAGLLPNAAAGGSTPPKSTHTNYFLTHLSCWSSVMTLVALLVVMVVSIVMMMLVMIVPSSCHLCSTISLLS